MTLLSLGQAEAAQQQITCTGSDILVEMRKTDPQAFAKIEQEAAAIPNGKGNFWRIEKAGTPTSYLLGTMHVTDPRVLEMPAAASPDASPAASSFARRKASTSSRRSVRGIGGRLSRKTRP